MSHSSQDLKRELGLGGVFAIALGAMVSSGFFLLPGIAMSETGPSLVLAYGLASLAILPAMAAIAELSTAMPRAGGAYYLLDRSMGRVVGTVTGLGTWAQLVLKSSFALVGLGAHLAIFVELPIQPLAIALAIAFMAVNLVGVQQTGLVQRLLVYAILAVLAYYLAQGLWHVAGGPGRDAVGERLDPFLHHGLSGLFATIGTVFVAYTGLTKVASVAEEIERPDRNIPLGMLLAWITVTVIYVVGAFVMVAVLGEQLEGEETPVATAGEAFLGWLPQPLGLVLVTIAALAAFASTANAGLLSASRYGLAMGRDRVVTPVLARIGRAGTPTYSIIVTAAAMIVAIVTLDVEELAKLASAFQLLVFALLNAAVIVMREARLESYRPAYRVPFYPWTQIFGFAVYLALIIAMGWMAILVTAVTGAVCAAWYGYYARHSKQDEPAISRVVARYRQGPGVFSRRGE